MNGKTELERLQTELRTTRIELAAAEYSVSEWERKFAEFASSVLRSSEAAEAAARGMYEAMWVQDREQLIAHFQDKEQLGKLARNLSAARQERDDAMRKRLELEDTLRTYQALEPERAKDARRQLAAQFAAEKERLAQMHAAECQRLAGESRQLRETLDNQASVRSDVEQRASELSIALERQKRATEKAQSRLAELDLAKERIRVLEDYITKEAERDVLRENQALHQRVSELVNAEGITSKLKALYERALKTIKDLNGVKEENDQLRDIATRVTLENSKNSTEVQFLRSQLDQSKRVIAKMGEDLETLTLAIHEGAADQMLAQQNQELRVKLTESRQQNKECETRLFAATQRFELELKRALLKTAGK